MMSDEQYRDEPHSDEQDRDEQYPRPAVGVGPWEGEWPRGPQAAEADPYYPYDPELLAAGDRRNVIDKYRYWSMAAIRADLRAHASALHIAIENLEHDLNIGSIVRTGNAFNVGGVHIVGRRKWNRRGAMVTDKYLDILHHPQPADLVAWARAHDYQLVAVDNMAGSTQLEHTELPERCVLIFGQESTGISEELLAAADKFVYIPQFGSTRSMNVAAAAAIAMHWWVAQYRA